MRRWFALALALLFAGCAQVSGLDGYCPLEENAPIDSRCRLAAPNCGCREGLACRLDDRGARRCEGNEDGLNLPPGASCEDGSQCAPGSGCYVSGGGICHSFCEFLEDCAPMGPHSRCIVGGGIGLCTVSCRPLSPDCGPGEVCATVDGGTFCAVGGEGTWLQECDVDSPCSAGLQCAEGRCEFICGPGLMECTGIRRCTRFGTSGPLGPDEYGVCM